MLGKSFSSLPAPFKFDLPLGPERCVRYAEHLHALYLWALNSDTGYSGLLAYHQQARNTAAKARYLASRDWEALKLGNVPVHAAWVDGEIVWGCTPPDEYGLLLSPMFRVDSSMEAAIIATTIARSTRVIQCAAR